MLTKIYLSLSLTVLILASAGAYAQPPNTAFEFDPGVTIGLELTRRVRLNFATGREKNDELDAAKWKVSAGASFRTKSLFQHFVDSADSDKQHVLVLGAGYEYSIANEAGERSTEHKLMFDGTGRYAVRGKLLVSDRSRFEFRWVNGDNHFRYRNRLMAERPLRIRKVTVTPYVSAEAYWDQRYKQWNKFEFAGGVEIPFIRRTTIDVYYNRTRCVTCSTGHTNVLGLTINFFFRWKG